MNKKECCRCCCEPKLSFDGLSSQVINDVPEMEEEHTAVFFGVKENTRYGIKYHTRDMFEHELLPAKAILEGAYVIKDKLSSYQERYLISGEQVVKGPIKRVGERVLLEELNRPVTIKDWNVRVDGTVVYYYTDYIKYEDDPKLTVEEHIGRVFKQLQGLALELVDKKDKEIDALHDRILELEKNQKKGFWKRG